MDESIPAVAVGDLRSILKSISSSLDDYEQANDSTQKWGALSSIAKDSQRMKDVTTRPADSFSDFTLRPLASVCVRIALSMQLFDHLPKPDCPTGVTDEHLAEATETDLDLTLRVLRGLVAFDVIQYDEERSLYRNSQFSLIYTDPSRRSWAIWLWDVMVQSATTGIGPYFDSHPKPLQNPTDPCNSPFTRAHNMHDANLFDIVREIGKLDLLNDAMSGSSQVCAREAVEAFDFSQLEPGNNGVVLVDVGGAKGQTILEVKRANPALKGTMILQDLKSVLDDGAVEGLDAEIMPYDFFEEVQPVVGASAYLYQRIFHDWGDKHSEKILASLRPSMAKTSRLLICDVVVRENRPHPRSILRDTNMLLIGGMERSQKQWNALLNSQGFEIEAIHGLDSLDNSMIEARLK